MAIKYVSEIKLNGGSSLTQVNGKPIKDITYNGNTYILLPKKALNDCTWEEISQIANADLAEKYFYIGETKAVTISGKNYNFRIVAFNHDTLTDGGRAAITFEMVDLYASYYLKSGNGVPWSSCEVTTTILPTIYNLLPDSLKNEIVSVNKTNRTSYTQNAETYKEVTSCNLFVIGQIELGSASAHASIEGHGYTYYRKYTTSSNKKKALNGTYTAWVMRTPYNSSNNYYKTITTSGGSSSAQAGNYGVAPCFCIGKTNKLEKPYIKYYSSSSSIFIYSDPDVTTYGVYANGELKATVTNTLTAYNRTVETIVYKLSDLGLSAGTYAITVKALTSASGVSESYFSEPIYYDTSGTTNYTVTFIANGSTVSSTSVAAGSTISLPSTPTRSGWEFVKWVYGSSNKEFTSTTAVTENTTVYAYWRKSSSGTTNCYHCNGDGTAECSICNGTGTESTQTCQSCNGIGTKMVCNSCGNNYYDGSTWNGTCDRCGGTTIVEIGCSTCGGNGEIGGTCTTCHGTGGTKCAYCGGTGQVTGGYIYEKY